jgi:hypothetical protein
MTLPGFPSCASVREQHLLSPLAPRSAPSAIPPLGEKTPLRYPEERCGKRPMTEQLLQLFSHAARPSARPRSARPGLPPQARRGAEAGPHPPRPPRAHLRTQLEDSGKTSSRSVEGKSRPDLPASLSRSAFHSQRLAIASDARADRFTWRASARRRPPGRSARVAGLPRAVGR